MRTNSDVFNLYNSAPQRELRLVVVIEFPVPLYLASHGDIPGVPAGTLGGVLQKVSSTSQRLVPEAGRAEIGAVSFDVVDLGGVITDSLRNQLASGNGIKGRTVRLYQGGKGMHWGDFRLEQTQVAEESLSYDHGRYSVRCRDIQREMRRDIFTPRSTTLAAPFPKGASTLSVFSTADFEPCAHTASFGDAPNQSVYYLKIKYQNGWEIVRATGKTAGTFTGVTRGLFGTLEYDHTLPEDSDAEKGIEVEEYIYLEMPGPALAYAVLTGNIPGTANSLPGNWHLGIDPALVVLDEFENIGADWYQPGDYSKGVILRFEGLTATDGKRFIEQEINLLLGAFMPVNAAGQLGYRRMAGVLANAGTVGTITADDVVSLGALEQDLAALKNLFSIQWAWYEAPGFDGRFLRANVLADAVSAATHGEGKTESLKFKGLHNSRHTFTTVKNRFDALRDRFAGPPLRLRLGLRPSKNDIEVGDVLRVALPQVRDYTHFEDGPNQYHFNSGLQGWTGIRTSPVAAGGFVSLSVTEQDPYFQRTLAPAERFNGADFPFVAIRMRRTSEVFPTDWHAFYYNTVGGSTAPHTVTSQFNSAWQAAAVGEWFEVVVDLRGVTRWMTETVSYIRFDIGQNAGGALSYSYDIDSIRVQPTADIGPTSLNRAMEVQRVSVDQTSGAVQVELFGSTQAAAPIADEAAGTSAELPNAWYSSAGTAMTAAGLSIDGSGFLSADGTLAGAASSRTIYYYLGDLTIPAGRTLTVTQNVELRVMGVLQIEGTLRGAPGNSGAGWLGSCRGGSGRSVGKYFNAPWANVGGEVVKGRNEVMPALAIDNDGGTLLGIPDDLRGSGGASGGNSYYYLQGDLSWEPAGFGGSGGAGGAGLAVVARGIAIGVAGKIDTSGGNGSPGTVAGLQYQVPGGSGGGGAPGGVLLIVDGHQNPQPVLGGGKIVACYGDSPDEPGRPGQGGQCLGTAAVRVLTVPKSRTPYPNYLQDPEIPAEVQQALADAEAAQQAAAAAQADATAALAKLDDIGADGKLHPVEKLRLQLVVGQVTGEQAGLDAQADQLGLALLRGDYDGALAALTSYLGGLTPAWDDTTQVTPISRTIWNTNWQNLYDARQALLNAVSDALKTRADNAQSTANNAASAAATAQGAANTAQSAANAAQSDATAALADLTNIASDGKLHPAEKIRVNREYNEVIGERAGIEAQATSLGITTAKTNYSNAVNALTSYLQGLSPTWNATNSTTTIVRSTWNTRWQDVYVKRQILLDTISGALKILADNAQSSATSASNAAGAAQATANSAQSAASEAQSDATAALADLDDIGADGKLHPAEKLTAIREWGAITGEQAGITASAASFAITTEKDAYTNAVNALASYLGGLSPAWNSTTSVTSISRTIWNSNWQAVYSARQALLDKIAARAGTLAEWAQLYGRPSDAALLNNLIDPSQWVVNSSGSQGAFSQNGNSSENWIGTTQGPYGVNEPVWVCAPDAASDSDGGWNNTFTNGFDPTRSYRFSVWVWSNHAPGIGSIYLGCNGSPAVTRMVDGVADSNPYFFVGQLPKPAKWYLVVGMLHGSTHGLVDTGVSGVYDPDTGRRVISGIEFKNNPAATSQTHRAYLYYETNTNRVVWFARPRVDLVDGNEPSILSLLGKGSVDNQRGLPMVQSDTASVALSAVCTAVDAGSTATINISAHSVQFGSFSVPYNSGSIAGLQFSKKYFVYCDDPGYQGGAVTYTATTNWATAKGSNIRRLVDVITTPANGGSSSGGGFTPPEDCVCADMWLTDALQARDAQLGDLVSVWDGGHYTMAGPIRETRLVEGVECVRLTTTSGAVVECSTSTPVTDRNGDVRRAPDTLDTLVGVSHYGSALLVWERIVAVEPIGPRAVCRIQVGGISYAAGRDADHRIITHNPTYKP